MSVRLRSKTGEVRNVPDAVAVEILDTSGNLAIVVTQSAGGIINILTPGDPMFNAHAVVTRQKVSRVHIHEPQPTQQPAL